MSLRVRELRVQIGEGKHTVQVLRGVDLELAAGKVTGLVGETGSGKSMTALAAMGLLPGNARIVSGSISLDGRDLLTLTEDDWEGVRGRELAIIFQNAKEALHPLIPIGRQISRLHRRHHGGSAEEALESATKMLRDVGLSDAEEQLDAFPHQLSGGQCQRVMNAMALICSPRVLIADEPTSDLDVTVQQQVLAKLLERVRESQTTLLWISHDMGLIRKACDFLAVMYAGQVVEFGSREQVLGSPGHPYTRALLSCLDPEADPPTPFGFRRGPAEVSTKAGRMAFVPGSVPDLRNPVAGCAFANRCPDVMDECRSFDPSPYEIHIGHWVRCLLHREKTI